MGKFNVYDRVRVSNSNTFNPEHNGKKGTILNIDGTNKPYLLDFDDGSDGWVQIIELVESKQNSPSKNTTMTTKTIYQVLVVNKKTGVAEKEKTLSADNEQQAILKTFGVDAENTFIKVTEVGSYEEDKPLKAIIEKPTK